MVKYSNHPEDLSNCPSYPDFLEKMRIGLEKLHNALLPGGVLAILIGDRRKRGIYTPIFHDLLKMGIGTLKSIIIKVQHNTFSSSKTYHFASLEKRRWMIPIAHEYCLLFRKTE